MTKREEIREAMRQEILSGAYEAHQQLPTMSDLEDRFDTSKGTVQRAMSDLIHEGLVYSKNVGGGGYFRAV